MQIPVLKKNNNTSELVLLDLNDILFIKIENRNIVYHTENEKYIHISTLSEWEDHLLEFGFDMLDKTNIVNMNRVKKMDFKNGNIYFEEEPTKDSKFASVAFIKQKVLAQQIQMAISRNTNTTMEVNSQEEMRQPESFLSIQKNLSTT